MRVGILTYHCPPNFGAQLQAISTVGFLKKCGHEPIVLHYYPKDLEEMYFKRIPKYQIECHKRFTKEVLPLSALCRNEDELINEINKLDLQLIILGSDALFKYVPMVKRTHFSFKKFRIVRSIIVSCEDLHGNPFFGGFISKLKKVIPVSAFSVSSQNCPFEVMTPIERNTMGDWMRQFSQITVRDEWTANMVKFLTGKDIISITPDPVFSFNQNCYLKIPSKKEITEKYDLNENYILLSFSHKYINEKYLTTIKDELEHNKIQPVALPMPEELVSANIEKKIDLPLSPLDWYALIIHSKGYIGERMHPIVVCLHNSIPFYCFDEYGIIDRKLGGLIKRHNLKSSKTYLVVKTADFTDHLYSYWSKKSFPLAKEVVWRILSFDKNKCSSFSSSYQQKYTQAMNNLLGTM